MQLNQLNSFINSLFLPLRFFTRSVLLAVGAEAVFVSVRLCRFCFLI